MHAGTATPALTANHCPGNGIDHLRIVERPDAHIIFPWRVIRHVWTTFKCKCYIQQNFDKEFARKPSWNHVASLHNTRMCEIDIECSYSYIYIEYRNPETQKTRNCTKLVQVRTLLPLSLMVFRHEERETQSFYADCFYIVSSQPNQRAAPVAHKVVAQLWKSTFFFRGESSTNCFFSNLSPRFRCVTSPKYPGPNSYLGFLFWHLWMTHSLCARVNACVNVAPN